MENQGEEIRDTQQKMQAETDPPRPEQQMKKNRLLEVLKKVGRKIGEVFREFPVTMGAIMLATLIASVLVDFRGGEVKEFLEKAGVFFLLIAFQALFFEEVFREKKKIRLGGSIFAAVSAAIFVIILFWKEEFLLGMKAEMVIDVTSKILIVYVVFSVALSIYHMFGRLEKDFEVYVTRAFLELMKAVVVYGLFAIGLAIIIVIFNELIFDTDEFVWRVELFLAGGIFAPMCLKAVSGKNEKPGRFAGICINYVLLPMLLLSFAIIYLYLFKIFASGEVPSNRVFPILAFLFGIGMPVWTLVHGWQKEKGDVSKLAVFLPYLFLPFVALQAWCIGIRIARYGYTYSRYMGVTLIIFETVYFALYLIQHLQKRQAVCLCLHAVCIMTAVGLLMPVVNVEDTIIRSQIKRLDRMLEVEKVTSRNISSFKSTYREIKNTGWRGQNTLQKRYSEEQLKEIKLYVDEHEWRDTRVSIYSGAAFTDVDISKYRHLYAVRCFEVPDAGTAKFQVEVTGQSDWEERRIDLRQFIDRVTGEYRRDNRSEFSLSGCEIYAIDKDRDLFITNVSMTFDEDTKEVSSFNMEGYLLEK